MLKMNDQKGYRDFINARDNALELILRNARLRITEITQHAFTRALETIQAKYQSILHSSSRHELDRLEQMVQAIFDSLSYDIHMELVTLRRKAYMLSWAGEAQAISQTVAKTANIKLGRHHISSKVDFKALSSGLPAMQSFTLALSKIRRQMISAIEYSLAMGETVDKALGRVYFCLPKQRALPKRAVLKTVKKLKEANSPKYPEFETTEFEDGVEIAVTGELTPQGFEFDSETWSQIIKDLGQDYVPVDRSPETFVDMTNPFNDLPIKDNVAEADKYYAWQVENDVVDDFVHQVRDGQVDAANANGITDFVWIAILDDKTDDCCEWRSGLLTSEIEAELEDKHADDDCRESVPPAHFNCRCTLAPASDDLEAVDTTESERGFDEWLNQK